MYLRPKSIPLSFSLLAGVFLTAQAAAADAFPDAGEQIRQQQQRQQALEQQIEPKAPDVRLSPPVSSFGRIDFPVEKPCFPIARVELQGQQTLPHWLPLRRIASQAQGKCLGAQGINLLMSALQNRLVDHGYVTTRVLAPSQDLNSGALRLVILPGYVREAKLTPESDRHLWLYSAFPAHAGNLLDLRDIEQGLENLQRLPTVEADMSVVPGEQPGESDIQVRWKQQKMWRVGLSLDDSGTRSTGRYLGGVTLSLDNPFALSDLFYLSATYDLQGQGGKGSKNFTGHYSVPFGYWMFSVTGSDYDYHQTVAGTNQDYRGSQKTSLTYDVLTRETRNYINDTEVQVQRRQTAAWRIGLQHRHYIRQATLDAGVSYQRGTRWFGAQPAPEEYFGEATALSKIVQLNAQFNLPFRIGDQRFRYNMQYLRQMSSTPLTPQEQFSIGNRWTVRGFDGERTLNASRGWYLRNDIAWSTPLPAQEFYLGVDYGEVGGAGSELLTGQHLAGGVAGLRGQAFRTSDVTLGFNLNWSY
ncbi:MAG: ShlB/FhaC/HecB family hemolysin secretion/activation protein [Pantoea sp.]|nr:ShlB/FhaC/HecB family hemolysin secretion/activation protein [Pantoea sp.]